MASALRPAAARLSVLALGCSPPAPVLTRFIAGFCGVAVPGVAVLELGLAGASSAIEKTMISARATAIDAQVSLHSFFGGGSQLTQSIRRLSHCQNVLASHSILRRGCVQFETDQGYSKAVITMGDRAPAAALAIDPPTGVPTNDPYRQRRPNR